MISINIEKDRLPELCQKKMNNVNTTLIHDLRDITLECIASAESFTQLDLKVLNWKETPETWSILECIEHLNLYGDFYLPEIRTRMQRFKGKHPVKAFKESWWGNYFVNAVTPKENTKKMKAFKRLSPSGGSLSMQVLTKFIQQQHQMLQLLEEAKDFNLNKITTASTIPMVRFRLGDTFRAEILHNKRHILQAHGVLSSMNR